MTSRARLGRTGLSALVVAALLTAGGVASTGVALAEPPQHAADNHDAAKDGKVDNDSSVLHDDPAPQPVTVAVAQAATVAPAPDLLPCGQTITADGKGKTPDVSVTRLVDANLSSASDCDPFPYELKSIPNGVRFVKPTGYPLSQFFVDVTWIRTPETVDDAPTVDFEVIEGGYNHPIGDCPASVRDENGDVVGLSVDTNTSPEQFAALGIYDLDGAPSIWHPEDNGLTQFACIADTSSVFEPWSEGGPRFLVQQRLWLMGDVIFRG